MSAGELEHEWAGTPGMQKKVLAYEAFKNIVSGPQKSFVWGVDFVWVSSC